MRKTFSFIWNKDCYQSCIEEQDKSSDIEQQPPFGDRKKAIFSLKIGGGGYKTNRNII